VNLKNLSCHLRKKCTHSSLPVWQRRYSLHILRPVLSWQPHRSSHLLCNTPCVKTVHFWKKSWCHPVLWWCHLSWCLLFLPENLLLRCIQMHLPADCRSDVLLRIHLLHQHRGNQVLRCPLLLLWSYGSSAHPGSEKLYWSGSHIPYPPRRYLLPLRNWYRSDCRSHRAVHRRCYQSWSLHPSGSYCCWHYRSSLPGSGHWCNLPSETVRIRVHYRSRSLDCRFSVYRSHP